MNLKMYMKIFLSGAKNELELIHEYEQTPFDSPKKHHLEETILRMDSWNLEKRINFLAASLDAPRYLIETLSVYPVEKKDVLLSAVL